MDKANLRHSYVKIVHVAMEIGAISFLHGSSSRCIIISKFYHIHVILLLPESANKRYMHCNEVHVIDTIYE